jgi:hypothetical protein
MLQTQIFAGQVRTTWLKRQRGRFVKDLERLAADFDFARGELRVVLTSEPTGDNARDFDDVLDANGLRQIEVFLTTVWIENELRLSVTIAEIEENKFLAVNTIAIDPPTKCYCLANVRFAELTASVRS